MPIIYAVLVGLAMAFPEISYEAGPDFEQGVSVKKDAIFPVGGDKVPSVMKKIAICESNDTHFDKNGQVVKGKSDPRDIGRYQINKAFWEAEAKKLGHDIYTEEGNEKMAMYIFNKLGTAPWSKSKVCWSKVSATW